MIYVIFFYPTFDEHNYSTQNESVNDKKISIKNAEQILREAARAEDKNKKRRRRRRRARHICRRVYPMRAQARGPRRTTRCDERPPHSAAYFRERGAAEGEARNLHVPRGAVEDTKNGAAFVRLRGLRDFARGSGVTRLCAASRLSSRSLRALRGSRRRPSNFCRGLRLRAV